MQVINAIDESTTEVLIGQANKAVEYTVSNDSALMSMLSTGLYENPLKSMIQETMFNAWDSHKMNGSENIPIEIHISEVGGLVIRDYGPGIPKEDMHKTYCVYGGSTKRDDQNQTGGFGLGCKAPFSYTESFTVTSNNVGERTVYLISRMTDALDGKPGLTPMISVPTEETGLMVTIPLKASDIQQTKTYVDSILKNSGIKVKLYYKDDDVIESYSPALAPDEYILDLNNNRGIYASYGGVCYQIKNDPFYELEYSKLLSVFSHYNVLIGFAPDTLTPLPNRENLNLSTRSLKNIKKALQTLIGMLKPAFIAMAKAYFEASLKKLSDEKNQPQFAIVKCLKFKIQEYKLIQDKNIPNYMWNLALDVLTNRPNSVIKHLLMDGWVDGFKASWSKHYPEHTLFMESILDLSKRRNILADSEYELLQTIREFYYIPFQQKLLDFEILMEKFNPKMKIRCTHDTNWSSVKRNEQKGLMVHDINLRHKYQLFLYDRIILAKSLRDLNESEFCISSQFPDGISPISALRRFGPHFPYEPIFAYVVNTAKGGFDAAKVQLEKQGFKVIICTAPPKESVTSTYRDKTIFKRFCHNALSWEGEEFESPTHFVYATSKQIAGSGRHSFETPAASLIHQTMINHRDTAIIHNISQAKALQAKGILSFEDTLRVKINDILSRKVRFRNIVRVEGILAYSCFEQIILMDPKIQKLFHMNIPKDDTLFWEDTLLLNIVSNQRSLNIRKTVDQVKKAIKDTWNEDPHQTKIKYVCNKTDIFNSIALSRKWRKGDEAAKENLTKKIVQFLRTK